MDNFLWRLPPTLYLAIQQTFRSGNRVLALISVLGIAVCVLLATGIEMASRTLRADLDRTSEALSGRADLHVTAGAERMPEGVLEVIRGLDGVATASPISSTSVWTSDGMPLHIIGLDFLSEHSLHGYSLSEQGVEVRDPLRLLSQPDSIVITALVARRLGLSVGDEFRASSDQGIISLTVRGLLEPGGIADAYGGNVAAMDVYSLQFAQGLLGFLQRVDISVSEGANREEVAETIRRAVGGTAIVSSSTDSQRTKVLASTLQQGVLAVVVLAVGVAALVAYITMAMSIDRRLRELALLQLAGLDPRNVQAMIIGESLVTGILGVAVGTPLGVLASGLFLVFFSKVVSTVAGVEFESAQFGFSTALAASGVGLGAATVAAIRPAGLARRTRPLDVFEASNPGREPVRSRVPFLVGAIAAAAVGWLGTVLPPYMRLALVCSGSLIALAIAVRVGIPPARRVLTPAVDYIFPRIGDLIGAALVARAARSAHTVTGIAAIVAACLAISATVSSVTSTVNTWYERQFDGSIRVVGGSPFALFREPLRTETVRRITELSGIEAIVRLKIVAAQFKGEEIFVSGEDLADRAEFASLELTPEAPEDVLERLSDGQVLVTTIFARRFGARIGELIRLRTPSGELELRIAGVVADYSPVGGISMPIEQFSEIWPGELLAALWVWPRGNAEEVARRIIEAVGDEQLLDLSHGEAMKLFGTNLFQRFSTLFFFMSALAGVVGSLVVANLILGSVLERRNELALLRVAGVRTSQVASAVVLDALATAMLGTVAGVGLSMLWADPMLAILDDAFGWQVEYHYRAEHVVVAVLAAGMLSVLSGVYPSWRARRGALDLQPLLD